MDGLTLKVKPKWFRSFLKSMFICVHLRFISLSSNRSNPNSRRARYASVDKTAHSLLMKSIFRIALILLFLGPLRLHGEAPAVVDNKTMHRKILMGYQGWCQTCKSTKGVSKMTMPYAAKLLVQEMLSMNVLVRLKLEDEFPHPK